MSGNHIDSLDHAEPREPEPGDIVLLKLAPTIERPLLVTSAWSELQFDREQWVVSGELFVRHEEDRSLHYVATLGFYKPDKEHRTIEIKKALQGELIGCWRFKPTPEPTPIPLAALPKEATREVPVADGRQPVRGLREDGRRASIPGWQGSVSGGAHGGTTRPISPSASSGPSGASRSKKP